MADYREISQTYAQEGVKAALLINSGAAVTVLTQATDLIEKKLASVVLWPMVCWSFGIAAATIIWAAAFVSTRYVDKGILEQREEHLRTSDFWMTIGLVLFLLSILAFGVGAVLLAYNLTD